ncbi:hypothetical protein WOLCODRAFT_17329 [Wolfiporia cocos MD-104 SS10]|uniref:Uncharacterized protein n=1 Tax=Wolfiporia cocos (strain MD-104) TaxID=742152 RepID=A0A2H3JSJ9_WOLCO|nr:hypothetical protein WOLCODRAFT_17329 [Wolfiporia cocos MD-104 SS10]
MQINGEGGPRCKLYKKILKTVIVSLVTAGIAVGVAYALAPALLGVLGFGAAGPVAGSVSAGSLFSIIQAIGMGVSIPVGMVVVPAIISSITAGLAAWEWDNLDTYADLLLSWMRPFASTAMQWWGRVERFARGVGRAVARRIQLFGSSAMHWFRMWF